jgi:Zn-dependent M28 family amino/carboxypeptidase
VLITQFSNEQGESHGSFAGEGGALSRVERSTVPPTVHVRLEDLAAAGIEGWGNLARVESATLRWDADVLSPAFSGNLVARIPGRDGSKAVVLGAHIDSVNNPGAMDDGSGSAILLEIARVLDAAQVQPPTDLYLAWFGSEELGLLGSAHFASTHQDVVGRAVAMLQIDCLTYPLEGIDAELTLVTWSGSPLGEERHAWPAYLAEAARLHGVPVGIEDVAEVYSDNHVFGLSAVANADLIYIDGPAMEATGSLHYAAHIHDPYDSVELVRGKADVIVQMARIALTAALMPLP